MQVPVSTFNSETKLWYAHLVASAIKADKEVDPSELEFLILTLHFLDEKQKTQVKAGLRVEAMLPGLQNIPKGLSKKDLAIIFTELILVIISDGRLTVQEKAFLKTVSDWFGYSMESFSKFVVWGEKMLNCEKERRALIAKN